METTQTPDVSDHFEPHRVVAPIAASDPAGFASAERRAASWAIDWALCLLALRLLVPPGVWLSTGRSFAGGLLLVAAAFTLLWWRGQTPGMRLVGIRLIDWRAGGRPNPLRLPFRFALALMPVLAAPAAVLFLVAAAFASALGDSNVNWPAWFGAALLLGAIGGLGQLWMLWDEPASKPGRTRLAASWSCAPARGRGQPKGEAMETKTLDAIDLVEPASASGLSVDGGAGRGRRNAMEQPAATKWRTCPACGAPVWLPDGRCGRCGQPVTASAPPLPRPPAPRTPGFGLAAILVAIGDAALWYGGRGNIRSPTRWARPSEPGRPSCSPAPASSPRWSPSTTCAGACSSCWRSSWRSASAWAC